MFCWKELSTILIWLIVTIRSGSQVLAMNKDSYHRVGLMSLSRLVVLAGEVEPQSCWCAEPFTPCPVSVPHSLFHQALNVSCEDLKILCCKPRAKDDDESLLHSLQSSKIFDIKHFLNIVAEVLRPEEKRTGLTHNTITDVDERRENERYRFPPAIGADLRDISWNPYVEAFRRKLSPQSLMDPYQVGSRKTLNYPMTDHLTSGNVYKRSAERDVGEDLITMFRDILNYFLTSVFSSDIYQLARSIDNASDIVFSNINNNNNNNNNNNRIQEHDSLSENYSSFHDASEDNETSAVLVNKVDKGDLSVPYEDLGWFSKAVEAAMDGSVYVGVAIAVLYFAGMFLSGLTSTVSSTCLICHLIGNYELVPVSV